MVKWKEQMVIEAPINRVWELFQDEQIQRIMPKVESHDLLEGENNATGAKHAQVYTEGKQQQRYIVETLAYADEPDRKYKLLFLMMLSSSFVLIELSLEQETDQRTRFIYEGENKGMNITGKMMLLAGSKKAARKTVLNFMGRVKEQAEDKSWKNIK